MYSLQQVLESQNHKRLQICPLSGIMSQASLPIPRDAVRFIGVQVIFFGEKPDNLKAIQSRAAYDEATAQDLRKHEEPRQARERLGLPI